MNIYVDESGSINNQLPVGKDFIIALIVPTDKKSLTKAYKRFISSNHDELKRLDNNEKMFFNNKFKELKGSQFDRKMKKKFVKFFAKEKRFELYYVHVKNSKLNDNICENTARAFNYILKLAVQYFITKKLFLDEDYNFQLDERNEKTETRYFLENYLISELTLGNVTDKKFSVKYYDSSNNKIIQIADVLANIYYSNTLNGEYEEEIDLLKRNGILKFTFEFPLSD